jgi:hypothetical protein
MSLAHYGYLRQEGHGFELFMGLIKISHAYAASHKVITR